MAKQLIDHTWTKIPAPVSIRLPKSDILANPLSIDWVEAELNGSPNADALYSVYAYDPREPLTSNIDIFIRTSTDKEINIDLIVPKV